MTDYFDICGTPIKYSEIKSFRLVQREYIYRPTYMETEKQSFLRNKKYNFFGMQPYAAIYDENEKHSALKEYKAKDFKESVGKDLIEGVITTIGDKWHIKAITSRKYICVNQAGRKFTTYLEDIPALLMRQDGKASDIHKNDELYTLLGEPIAPAINIVYALQITAKETYVFFGNDIHSNTFLHYLEDKTNAPYLQNAIVKIKDADGTLHTEVIRKHLPGDRSFYGYTPREGKFYRTALKKGLEIKVEELGMGRLQLMDLKQLHDIGMEMFKEDPLATLCDNPNCRFCRKYTKL